MNGKADLDAALDRLEEASEELGRLVDRTDNPSVARTSLTGIHAGADYLRAQLLDWRAQHAGMSGALCDEDRTRNGFHRVSLSHGDEPRAFDGPHGPGSGVPGFADPRDPQGRPRAGNCAADLDEAPRPRHDRVNGLWMALGAALALLGVVAVQALAGEPDVRPPAVDGECLRLDMPWGLTYNVPRPDYRYWWLPNGDPDPGVEPRSILYANPNDGLPRDAMPLAERNPDAVRWCEARGHEVRVIGRR